MVFIDRAEAGTRLAWCLGKYADRDDVLVLGVPRGGVPVAFEVATLLKVPLDVFVLRKLGVPGHEELALGAIGSGGVRVLDKQIIRALQIPDFDIELITRAEKKELERREHKYRRGSPPLDVRGKTVILVDDGIATGSSLTAGVHALRQMHAASIVVAVPVAPRRTLDRLQHEVDELVCVEAREPFYGVGQFYRDFSQVSDEEVNELLERASQQHGERQYHEVVTSAHR